MMSPITTHVLDTSLGKPAAGIAVKLLQLSDSGESSEVGTGVTNADGRIADLLPEGTEIDGTYRIVFDTADYYRATGQESFYPSVEVTFVVQSGGGHYHVPLLLSPFGYSTYRGS